MTKVNVVVNLACFRSVPHRPLLAPIYRWPGLKEREGSDTYYNIVADGLFNILDSGASLTTMIGCTTKYCCSFRAVVNTLYASF
jgi:hypothetical protein